MALRMTEDDSEHTDRAKGSPESLWPIAETRKVCQSKLSCGVVCAVLVLRMGRNIDIRLEPKVEHARIGLGVCPGVRTIGYAVGMKTYRRESGKTSDLLQSELRSVSPQWRRMGSEFQLGLWVI